MYTATRFARHLDAGWTALEWARNTYKINWREYVGRDYGEGDDIKRAINLIQQAVTVIIPNVIAQRPDNKVRPGRTDLRGEAAKLEKRLDYHFDQQDIAQKVRDTTIDAMLAPIGGLLKVGFRMGGEAIKSEDGRSIRLAEPFVDRIHPDMYACDPEAKSIDTLQWEAHKYPIRRDLAVRSGLFGRDQGELPEGLPPGVEVATRKEAAEFLSHVNPLEDGQREADVSGTALAVSDQHVLTERIMLWDVVIYEAGTIFIGTLAASADNGEAVESFGKWLAFAKWDGPETGPIQHLGFHRAPGNVPYVAPVSMWIDLHDAMVTLSAKLVRSVKNQKRNFTYTPAVAQGALALAAALDGQAIMVQDPTQIGTIDTGGLQQGVLDSHRYLMENFNSASNVQQIAGSSSIADTATEASLLHANAAVKIRDMRDTVAGVMGRIARHFAWYELNNPLAQWSVQARLGGGRTVDVTFDAARRNGTLMDYSFTIDVTTMLGEDSMVRARRLIEMFQVFGSLLPFVQQGVLDGPALAQTLGREFNMTELDEIFADPRRVMELAQLQMQPDQMAPGPQGQVQQGSATSGRIGQVRGALAAGTPQGFSRRVA